LKPPPERRLRRAKPPSSPVQHHAQPAATTADFTRSWHTSPRKIVFKPRRWIKAKPPGLPPGRHRSPAAPGAHPRRATGRARPPAARRRHRPDGVRQSPRERRPRGRCRPRYVPGPHWRRAFVSAGRTVAAWAATRSPFRRVIPSPFPAADITVNNREGGRPGDVRALHPEVAGDLDDHAVAATSPRIVGLAVLVLHARRLHRPTALRQRAVQGLDEAVRQRRPATSSWSPPTPRGTSTSATTPPTAPPQPRRGAPGRALRRLPRATRHQARAPRHRLPRTDGWTAPGASSAPTQKLTKAWP
jgi:hypothetical protein